MHLSRLRTVSLKWKNGVGFDTGVVFSHILCGLWSVWNVIMAAQMEGVLRCGQCLVGWFIVQRFSLMERKLKSSEGMEFNT